MTDYLKSHKRTRNDLYGKDDGEVAEAWEALTHGESINDDTFLVKLKEQEEIKNDILNKARIFNNNKHTEIYFIKARNGGGKSQIHTLLETRLSALKSLVISYDLSNYEDTTIGELFQEVLSQIWEECKFQISKRSAIKGIKKQFNDRFVDCVKSGKFLDRLKALKPHFKGGFFFLFDEFDSLNERQISRWAKSFRNISEHMRGTFWIVMTCRKQLEILSKEETSKRYVDLDSGKHIYDISGVYKKKAKEAAGKITALYERSNGIEFEDNTLKFIDSFLDEVEEDIEIYKSIRSTNNLIHQALNKIKTLEDNGIFNAIYKSKRAFKKASIKVGGEIEEGIRDYLLDNFSEKFNLGKDVFHLRYGKENINLTVGREGFESDGKIIIEKKRRRGWTQVNEIPIEIKSTLKGKIKRKKINTFAKQGGIIAIVAGWIEKLEMFREKLVDYSYLIFIPNEFSLLFKQYKLGNENVKECIEFFAERIIDLPGLVNFAEQTQKRKSKSELIPTSREVLSTVNIAEVIQVFKEQGISLNSSEEIKPQKGQIGPKPTSEKTKTQRDNLQEINGIGPSTETDLNEAGFFTFKGIAKATISELEKVNNVAETTAKKLKKKTKTYLKEKRKEKRLF